MDNCVHSATAQPFRAWGKSGNTDTEFDCVKGAMSTQTTMTARKRRGKVFYEVGFQWDCADSLKNHFFARAYYVERDGRKRVDTVVGFRLSQLQGDALVFNWDQYAENLLDVAMNTSADLIKHVLMAQVSSCGLDSAQKTRTELMRAIMELDGRVSSVTEIYKLEDGIPIFID